MALAEAPPCLGAVTGRKALMIDRQRYRRDPRPWCFLDHEAAGKATSDSGTWRGADAGRSALAAQPLRPDAA